MIYLVIIHIVVVLFLIIFYNKIKKLVEKSSSKDVERYKELDNKLEKFLELVDLNKSQEISTVSGEYKSYFDRVSESLDRIELLIKTSLVQESKNGIIDVKADEKSNLHIEIIDQNENIVSDVQYNDAISEFERINDRIFKLRKYRLFAQKLLEFLSNGTIDQSSYNEELSLSDLSEEIKDHFRTILYDIDRFNTQRRSLLSLYVRQNNLECFDIRYPINQFFDENYDHHFKGDEVMNGDKIVRVCKLGYFFPNSPRAPYRVKSEVETEELDE